MTRTRGNSRPLWSIHAGVFTVIFAGLASPRAEATPIQWAVGSGGNGHWYEAVSAQSPSGISWTAAQADAAARGGYLATILSSEENAFVFSLVDSDVYWKYESTSSTALLGPWLGGSQVPGSSEPGDGWMWLNNDGGFAFTSWLGGEPSNGAGNPHGQPESHLHYFNYGSRTATWNDLPDSLPQGPIAYVVEYNSDPTTPTPVPEPGSIFNFVAGLSGLAALRRRWN